MALRPARLEAQFVPRIWGARSLAPLFPEKQSLGEPIGEVWLTGNECRFADGPFAGERLGDAWPRMGEEWTGQLRHRQFPILAKFLFPEDKLSVQVHPDDEYAMRHEAAAGGAGKTEMWYVVSARPDAQVRVGLKPEVDRDRFRRAIGDNTAEECIERVPVRAGDVIFVPAGTVHTIGPGMVLCEIQQNSDLTYRVFDYHRLDAHGKPRDLHIEKAFDVIRFGKQHGGKVAGGDPGRARETRILVECPYFRVSQSVFSGRQPMEVSGALEIIIVLEGKGTLGGEGGASAEYARAQTWLAPAAARECRYQPWEPTTILRVSLPEAEGRKL